MAEFLFRGEIAEEIFFYISFQYVTWDRNPSFTSNKPTHYVLYVTVKFTLIYAKSVRMRYQCISNTVNGLFTDGKATSKIFQEFLLAQEVYAFFDNPLVHGSYE